MCDGLGLKRGESRGRNREGRERRTEIMKEMREKFQGKKAS